MIHRTNRTLYIGLMIRLMLNSVDATNSVTKMNSFLCAEFFLCAHWIETYYSMNPKILVLFKINVFSGSTQLSYGNRKLKWIKRMTKQKKQIKMSKIDFRFFFSRNFFSTNQVLNGFIYHDSCKRQNVLLKKTLSQTLIN